MHAVEVSAEIEAITSARIRWDFMQRIHRKGRALLARLAQGVRIE
jgi:hypothetical protein